MMLWYGARPRLGDSSSTSAAQHPVPRPERPAIEGIRFVRVRFAYHDPLNWSGLDFVAVDRKDYRRLYRIALRCRRDFEPPSQPPVLPAEQADLLWKNTIGYLDRA